MKRLANPDDAEKYAVYLGIDLKKDRHLLWIAEEALSNPLPQNWEEKLSSSTGQIYFYNTLTGESSLKHPLEDYYADLYRRIKENRVTVEDLRLVRHAEFPARAAVPHKPVPSTAPTEPSHDACSAATLSEIAPACDTPLRDPRVRPSDMLDMAGYLSIDLAAEPHLIPLVYEALVAPVPKGWRECFDSKNQPYFYHEASDRSCRQHPADSEFKRVIAWMREKHPTPPRPDLGSWMRFVDAEGSVCYYDFAQNIQAAQPPDGFVDTVDTYLRSAQPEDETVQGSECGLGFGSSQHLERLTASPLAERVTVGGSGIGAALAKKKSIDGSVPVPAGVRDAWRLASMSSGEPHISQLEFTSWWTQEGERRYLQLSMNLTTKTFDVLLDKTMLFSDTVVTKYSIGGKQRPQQDLNEWELFVGQQAMLLGKRTTLMQASGKTIAWLEYHSQRLLTIIHKLETELLKFESFSPSMTLEVMARKTTPGSRCIRALHGQALELQQRLQVHRPGLIILTDIMSSRYTQ